MIVPTFLVLPYGFRLLGVGLSGCFIVANGPRNPKTPSIQIVPTLGSNVYR